MAGIEQTQEVIGFIQELAKAIGEAKADGKLDIFDCMRALKLAPSLTSAVRGVNEIKEELADLNGEEKDLLLAILKEAIFSLVEALT